MATPAGDAPPRSARRQRSASPHQPPTRLRTQIPLPVMAPSPHPSARRASHRAPLLAATYTPRTHTVRTPFSPRTHRPAGADTHGPAKRANYTPRAISSANPLRACAVRCCPRSRYLCAGFPSTCLSSTRDRTCSGTNIARSQPRIGRPSIARRAIHGVRAGVRAPRSRSPSGRRFAKRQ
ncbi:hypothetical protein HYPSUDRAFT_373174 [Hypholoma sublateritium FD-334 SS-4]|uniref:Uncharacterized protein n=1 Tax=Hypholoma sublateritium (strain FD-334 SS-4) TaxID=945553 RepID=A0A0D2LE24_HYPSF|nr:hypothetical protein HYPSUDRAFT_373174 [Hypholoma sublateritium FD-334 SS-4]